MKNRAPLALSLLAIALLGTPAAAQIAWNEVQPTESPAPRYGHTMARNHPSFQPFLFGGTDGVVSFGDTWIFDGANWLRRATTGPAPRHDHAMAMLHYTDDSMLVFGGEDASGALLGDTWKWNGTSWSPLATSTAPSPRKGHAIARDEYQDKVLFLFGGRTANGLSDETWRFANGQWQLLDTPVRPRAREGHAMTMVNGWQSIVLFGGHDGSTVFDDVWEFDGLRWHALGTLPAPRTNHAFVYEDFWRGRIMTFGGSDGATFGDTVEQTLDGDWVTHATIGAPSPRDESAMALAFGVGHSIAVLFGGRDKNGVALGDTWIVEPLTVPTSESFGQGCGPGAWSKDGGANLFVTTSSILLGSTVSMTAYTPTPGRGMFLIGDEIANPPAGCGALVAPTVVLSAPVESLFPGLASGTIEIAIPFEPSLLGAKIATQAIVEMGALQNRLSISEGLRLTIAE